MFEMNLGLQHFHKRVRKAEAVQRASFSVRVMDRLIYVIAILGPVFTFDQVAKVWIQHDVQGISVIAWGSYFFFSIFWILYGIIHKERVLIFSYTINFILNGLIFFGALMYR